MIIKREPSQIERFLGLFVISCIVISSLLFYISEKTKNLYLSNVALYVFFTALISPVVFVFLIFIIAIVLRKQIAVSYVLLGYSLGISIIIVSYIVGAYQPIAEIIGFIIIIAGILYEIRRRLLLLKIIVAILLIVSCLNIPTDPKDIKEYWSNIKSFEAFEIVEYDNITFESRIFFNRPDSIIREDYKNNKLFQKIEIKGHIQKIYLEDGDTIVLNATMEDINNLDPFVNILNNLDNLNFSMKNNIVLIYILTKIFYYMK